MAVNGATLFLRSGQANKHYKVHGMFSIPSYTHSGLLGTVMHSYILVLCNPRQQSAVLVLCTAKQSELLTVTL